MQIFPTYLAMGMTYDEFWRGPVWYVESFRKACEEKRKQEEWARWRQGAYIYDALLRVAPVMRASLGKSRVEPGKYPDEPWPMTEEEVEEREERKRRENYRKMLAKFEVDAAREKKKQAEQTAKEESASG